MRRPEAGIVLLSVLALLAIAATIVHLMLGPGEASVARSQRFSEAGQALALVRAGEQSAVAVLRRDIVERPEIDHSGEPWSAVAQAEIEIASGAFALAIADAHGRVNLNALAPAEHEDLRVLIGLGAAAGLTPEQIGAIAGTLEADGPLEGLDELSARAGLDPAAVAGLAPLADALPGDGPVNLNAAPVEVIAAVLGDPARARALAGLRDRRGFVRPEDLAGLGIELPAALGFRSDLYRLRVRARVGGTEQSVESLLHRRTGANGPEVAVVGRRAAFAGAPPALP